MSKYDALTLSFDEIEQIAGVTVDHSLLRYKKKMEGCGWRVEKIFAEKSDDSVCKGRLSEGPVQSAQAPSLLNSPTESASDPRGRRA